GCAAGGCFGYFFSLEGLVTMRKSFLVGLTGIGMLVGAAATPANAQQSAEKGAIPAKFDLRELGVVTPIKSQKGGTCWTPGTIAAIESNLLISGQWQKLGYLRMPACSEYHLDWWNGFNKHANEDVKDPKTDSPKALTVHQGGDYRVAAAYLSRGDG